MATETPATNQLTPPPLSSQAVYEAHSYVIFEIVRYFVPEHSIVATVQEIAKEFVKAHTLAKYERYAKLMCVRVTYEALSQKSALVSPFSKINASLSFEDSYCIMLRERFDFSPSEIAAVLNLAEGSVRTKLKKLREALVGQPLPSPKKNHDCVRVLERLEDEKLQRFSDTRSPIETDGCMHCSSFLDQRRQVKTLLQDFSQQDDVKDLPEPLQRFPENQILVKDGARFVLNWAAAPWYLKVLFEGTLAATLVLGVVLSVPRIKRFYEVWLERRLDLYSIAELATGLNSNAESSPEAADSKPLPDTSRQAFVETDDKLNVQAETEFSARETERPSSDKIYRILIKTDAPENLKASVQQLLTKHNSTSDTEDGNLGVELPGGIMFDSLIDLKDYKPVVNALARLGETKVIITRSREKKVQGKVHFKIWLQRI